MASSMPATIAMQAPVVTAPAGSFFCLRLVLQPGGLTIVLKKPELIVGRHSEADIRLPLPDVSRQHCRFTFRDGTWHVEDLNSLNGIHVNTKRVQESTLLEGDRLGIGSFQFEIRTTAEAPTPTVVDSDEDCSEHILRSILRALPAAQMPERKAS